MGKPMPCAHRKVLYLNREAFCASCGKWLRTEVASPLLLLTYVVLLVAIVLSTLWQAIASWL